MKVPFSLLRPETKIAVDAKKQEESKAVIQKTLEGDFKFRSLNTDNEKHRARLAHESYSVATIPPLTSLWYLVLGGNQSEAVSLHQQLVEWVEKIPPHLYLMEISLKLESISLGFRLHDGFGDPSKQRDSRFRIDLPEIEPLSVASRRLEEEKTIAHLATYVMDIFHSPKSRQQVYGNSDRGWLVHEFTVGEGNVGRYFDPNQPGVDQTKYTNKDVVKLIRSILDPKGKGQRISITRFDICVYTYRRKAACYRYHRFAENPKVRT